MKKERRKFSAQFKTKVILETIMERRIILQKSKVKFLLFTFAVFSSINFVSAQTKQVDLNGKEALVFSGTGNGDLRNVMNLDIALDSGLIVASMERVTTENPGFQIPSSDYLNEILNPIYKSLPKKEKHTCSKTWTCREPKTLAEILDAGTDWRQEMWAYSAIELALGFAHHHRCEKCKGWSDEYKRKVACHACKDSRRVFCGKTIQCPLCEGKGYYFTDAEQLEGLSFDEYLKEYSIEAPALVFYYNSPKDFGLYDLRVQRKFRYESGTKSYSSPFRTEDLGGSSSAMYVENISFVLQKGTESVRGKIEAYNKMVKENDEAITAELKELINQDKYEDAAILSSKIISSGLKQKYHSDIQNLLSEKYARTSIKLDESRLKKLIESNKEYFIPMECGKQSLSTDITGLVSINGVPCGIFLKNIPKKQFGYLNEYEITYTTNTELIIIIDTTKIPGEHSRFQTNGGYQIQHDRRGKPFRKKFLNRSISNNPVIETEQNSKVPKEKLAIVEKQAFNKYVNGVLVNVASGDVIIKEEKFANRIPKVAMRVTAILGGLSWLGLRFYENSQIP